MASVPHGCFHMSSRHLQPLLHWCFIGWVLAFVALPAAWAQPAAAARALVLDGGQEVIDVWPAATLRFDDTGALTLTLDQRGR